MCITYESTSRHSVFIPFYILFCFSLCFQDLISVLLPRVLPAITEGLQDLDDDVRAVAAAALIPVVEGLVQLLPNKVVLLPAVVQAEKNYKSPHSSADCIPLLFTSVQKFD